MGKPMTKDVTIEEAQNIAQRCGEQANRALEEVGRGIADSVNVILIGGVESTPSNRTGASTAALTAKRQSDTPQLGPRK